MKSHWKYLVYLCRHKWFVFVAGLRVGAPIWRLLVHDWSKVLPCEWLPYARYFYGNLPKWNDAKRDCPGYLGPTKESAALAFDAAWLHHQHYNPHHWQYWVLREDSGATKLLPMPLAFAREMVADWMGAGRAITGKWEAQAWYERSKEHIMLDAGTRQFVEETLAGEADVRRIVREELEKQKEGSA